MAKRTEQTFKRRDADAYYTPASACKPLIPHIPMVINGTWGYIDPCCGDGAIGRGLGVAADLDADIEGDYADTHKDATTHDYLSTFNRESSSYFITNPPWTRTKQSGYLMHRIIDNLSSQLPTWLLFDADWMHTKQATPYLRYCHKIVSVGRVSWMDNGTSGKDNCAWYLFDQNQPIPAQTQFIGR